MIENIENQIIQYIVIRNDLKWNVGSLIAQACHASIAAILENMENCIVKSYVEDINHMTKIILCCSDGTALCKLSSELETRNLPHKLWIEYPENIPTCIATMVSLFQLYLFRESLQ